jgi:hypothetical protein
MELLRRFGQLAARDAQELCEFFPVGEEPRFDAPNGDSKTHGRLWTAEELLDELGGARGVTIKVAQHEPMRVSSRSIVT